MCECKRRLILVFIRKISKHTYNIDKLFLNKIKALAHDYDIGIVADITARCTEVDYACRLRTLLSVSIHVAHYIMPYLLLALFGNIVIDVIYVLLHLVYHLIGDDGLAVSAKT